jgi:hypothetical protein
LRPSYAGHGCTNSGGNQGREENAAQVAYQAG